MKFEIYKKQQGTYARLLTVSALAIIAAFGANELKNAFVTLGNVTEQVTWLSWGRLIGGIFLVVCCVGIFFVGNNKKTVDFLIETEVELKKVSWSTLPEVIGSATVVVAVVIILAVLLFGVDNVLLQCLKLIGVL